MKEKRVFTVDQKMQILRDGEEIGMVAACRKHRSLKKRSPYKYIQTYFPEYADMHPFAAVASEYIMQTPTIHTVRCWRWSGESEIGNISSKY